MANINPPESTWADIIQLETTDKALAGQNQVMNKQAIAIAKRTNFLKNGMDANSTSIGSLQSSYSSLNTTVSSLSPRVLTLEQGVSSLNSSVSTLQQDVSDLESGLASSPGTLSDVVAGSVIQTSTTAFPSINGVQNTIGPITAINASLKQLGDRTSYLKSNADLLSGPTGASLIGFTRSGTLASSDTVQNAIRLYPASISQYSATTASSDNISNVQAAIDSSSPLSDVIVPAGSYNVSSIPVSTKAVTLRGPGKVLVADAYSGREQVNTYCGTRPSHYGKEYRFALWKAIAARPARAINVYTYGDSTMAGGFNYIDWAWFAQVYLPDAASKRIANKFDVTNKAVGGSNLSTWNPTPDIGVNSSKPADLVILKCAINDATNGTLATRLSLFESNLRNGLQAIRNTTGGDVNSVSILILGPNATVDKELHKRNAEWYEQVRPILESAAYDFKCSYIDTYQLFRDVGGIDGSIWASGGMMEVSSAVGAPPVLLHPRNVMQSWIWGQIIDFLFAESETLRYSANGYFNKSPLYGHDKANSTLYPNNYPDGVSLEIAYASDGYPFDGVLRTEKSSQGSMKQTIHGLASNAPTFSRTANITENFWGQWCGASYSLSGNSAYLNGWSDFGGSYGGGRLFKSESNVVTLDGLIKPGTATAGTTIFTLPSHMRPGNQRIIAAKSEASSMCELEIFQTGEFKFRSGTCTQYLILTGLSFRT
ncbi:tailspike protein [Stenotrophomonas phage CUB19]|nr:tailspike protein [Stenotrophomonas phage CUB19]